jgi:hypothetical protein
MVSGDGIDPGVQMKVPQYQFDFAAEPMRLVAEQGQDGDRMAMAALQRKMDISEAAAKQTRLERFETAHSRVFYTICREGLCSGDTQRVGAGAAAEALETAANESRLLVRVSYGSRSLYGWLSPDDLNLV